MPRNFASDYTDIYEIAKQLHTKNTQKFATQVVNQDFNASNISFYLNEDRTNQTFLLEYSLHGGFSPKVSVGVGNIAESKKPLIVHMCAFLQTPNDIKNLQLLFNSKQNQTITIETVSNTDTEMNNHSQFLVCKCEKCRHFLIEMAQKGVNLFSCTFVCSTLTLTKKMNKKGSQEVTSENSTNAELVKDSTYDK